MSNTRKSINYFHPCNLYATQQFLSQCPPRPFLQGGPETFSMLAKNGGLALLEFLGESGFFQGEGGGAEDF